MTAVYSLVDRGEIDSVSVDRRAECGRVSQYNAATRMGQALFRIYATEAFSEGRETERPFR